MLSVIIPTYNRAEILKTCLERLLAQKGVEPGLEPGPRFEVIVVDDGSTDNTKDIVSKFEIRNPKSETNSKFQIPNSKQTPSPTFQYIYQTHSQQGVARNRGVEAARGDIILFIGDDIFVQPGFLKTHYETHQRMTATDVVVLGYTTWDPLLEINDYMKFLESSGWQFGYGFLTPGFNDRPDRYKFFYTSNISMKKSFFEKEKFDESFRGYGWEDIELGYRLARNHGMRLFYEPAARAHHHHQMTESDLPNRMQTVGCGAKVFEKLHPEVRLTPRGFKRLLIKIATSRFGMLAGRLFGKNFYYKLRCWSEFW